MYTHIFTIPGLYNYDCSVGAHAQNGMAGTVTVNLGGCTDPNAFNYDSLATYDDGSCLYPDCNGIAYGTSLLDSCGVCQQAYIYDVVLHTVVLLDDTFNLSLSPTEILVMPNDPMNPYWNSTSSGCTDPLAAKYDSTEAWYPKDPKLQGRITQWLAFADSITGSCSAARLHDKLGFKLNIEQARKDEHKN